MNKSFPIITVNEKYQLEQLGTKPKFWFFEDSDAEKDNRSTLCKIGRKGTGENWAEKVACEIAKVLEIPCAHYDLAITDNHQAVVSPSFVPINGVLVHGNEVLQKVNNEYPADYPIRLRHYKINTVIASLKQLSKIVVPPTNFELSPEGGKQSIVDVFITYLMLDCLIGNQDRHDENWGVIGSSDHRWHLSPTFDHASSLACRITDQDRDTRLTTNDMNYSIEAFAHRAKTPFYNSYGKKLTTIECFQQAINVSKSANIAKHWINRLSLVTEESLLYIFNKFPDGYLSDKTVAFTIQYIKINQARIVDLKENI